MGGALGRGERIVEQALGALARALQAARGAGKGGLRTGGTTKLADRLVQGLGQPLGVLQQGTPGGEEVFLAGFGCQRVELGEVMAQQILFLAARGEAARGFGFAALRLAPLAPGPRHCGRSDRMLGEGVENGTVVGRIEEPALLELALDFDEAVAELAQ